MKNKKGVKRFGQGIAVGAAAGGAAHTIGTAIKNHKLKKPGGKMVLKGFGPTELLFDAPSTGLKHKFISKKGGKAVAIGAGIGAAAALASRIPAVNKKLHQVRDENRVRTPKGMITPEEARTIRRKSIAGALYSGAAVGGALHYVAKKNGMGGLGNVAKVSMKHKGGKGALILAGGLAVQTASGHYRVRDALLENKKVTSEQYRHALKHNVTVHNKGKPSDYHSAHQRMRYTVTNNRAYAAGGSNKLNIKKKQPDSVKKERAKRYAKGIVAGAILGGSTAGVGHSINLSRTKKSMGKNIAGGAIVGGATGAYLNSSHFKKKTAHWEEDAKVKTRRGVITPAEARTIHRNANAAGIGVGIAASSVLVNSALSGPSMKKRDKALMLGVAGAGAAGIGVLNRHAHRDQLLQEKGVTLRQYRDSRKSGKTIVNNTGGW